MKTESLRLAMKTAVDRAVRQINVPGISDAELNDILLDSAFLGRLDAELKIRQDIQTTVSANIKLFLRISNTDLLEIKERISFVLNLFRIGADKVEAIASTNADWGQCWVRGIEPIRRAALQGLRDTVRGLDETLSENDSRFMAAMVLLASEMVGPYVELLASFLEYQPSFVAAIAARLTESQVWDGDEIRCEKWFDPDVGGIAILLDILVATGELIRRWSNEKGDFIYAAPEIRTLSHRVC